MKPWLFILLVSMSLDLFAQEEEQGEPFFSHFFNPSIGLGVGSAHAYYAAPSFDLRIWRLSGRFSIWGGDEKRSGAFQLEADLIRLPSFKKYWNYTVASWGVLYVPFRSRKNEELTTMLLGINMYRKHGRHRFSIKAGIASYQTTVSTLLYHAPWGPVYKHEEQRQYLPFGEISWQLYMFPLRDMKKLERGGFSRYFNPGIYVGAGGAHPNVWLPYFSIKTGTFSFEGAWCPLPWLNTGSAQVVADLARLDEFGDYRLRLTASLGAFFIRTSTRDVLAPYLMPGLNLRRIGSRYMLDTRFGLTSNEGQSDFRLIYGQLSLGAFLYNFNE